jgi:hypothetical protein
MIPPITPHVEPMWGTATTTPPVVPAAATSTAAPAPATSVMVEGTPAAVTAAVAAIAPPSTPAPAMMTPMQTTTVKALVLVGLSQVLLALMPMFSAQKFDPWQLGTMVIPVIAGILIRMASGDVQAPAVVNALSLGLINSGNPK